MPQPTNLCNKSKKKVANSNGRIPAYNNTFAFRHNPKSKKTANILASPIQYCCRRCYEKIVWRKTYRKYKPLTQPTTCNLCKKRNITAAYHTVCNNCSVSHPKAMALLQEWNQSTKNSSSSTTTISTKVSAQQQMDSDTGSDQADEELTLSFDKNNNITTKTEEEDKHHSLQQQIQEHESNLNNVADAEIHTRTTNSSRRNHIIHKRVCTVCFKQPALPDTDTAGDNEEDDDDNNCSNRPLKLRQLKSLQRQRVKQEEEQAGRKKKPSSGADVQENNLEGFKNGDNNDESDDDHDEEDEYYDNEEDQEEDEDSDNADQNDDQYGDMDQKLTSTAALNLNFDNDDDMNDPFLQAIGGAKNLLVGDAYQKKLLEKSLK